MTDHKPFRPDKAAHLRLGELHTDFFLPICLPDPELQVGDAPVVLVVTAVEEHRVGVPMGVNALEHLLGIVEAGLRLRQAPEEGAAQ